MSINKEDLNKTVENYIKKIDDTGTLWKQIVSLLNSNDLFYKEEIEENSLIEKIS